jgi:cytochrome c oxidase assembly protein subunit 15
MPHYSPDALRETRNRAVMTWLFVFAFIVAFLVVFEALSALPFGLSITEWNPISGTLPPIGQQVAHRIRQISADA